MRRLTVVLALVLAGCDSPVGPVLEAPEASLGNPGGTYRMAAPLLVYEWASPVGCAGYYDTLATPERETLTLMSLQVAMLPDGSGDVRMTLRRDTLHGGAGVCGSHTLYRGASASWSAPAADSIAVTYDSAHDETVLLWLEPVAGGVLAHMRTRASRPDTTVAYPVRLERVE